MALRGRELRALLREGHPIDGTELDNREYRGISLGLPHAVEALTWKTFTKTFYRHPTTGRLVGWNQRMVQHGVDGPWEAMLKKGRPVTFGHYEVVEATPHNTPAGFDRGLLIDYGRGNNHRFDPVSMLRDPIVALTAGSVEILLGATFVALGGRYVPTPSFFCLIRDTPVDTVATPPS
jgi:hypothetical protein